MRRVKIQSFDDLMGLPEGEWVEIPDGLDFESVYPGTVRIARDRVVVELPEGAAERLRPGRSETLTARLSKGRLIIERHKRKGKGASRRPARSR
jgi:hypothetical protein